ncbi:MAG: heterodisulfide reductase-related iron-sulfur binding cluster [Candidatus Limnocylindria bacterium]
MATTVLFPNHLAKERSAAGLSREKLSELSGIEPRLYVEMEEGRLLPSYLEMERIRTNLGGLEPAQLYAYSLVNTIGDKRFWQDKPDYARFYDSMAEGSHLLVQPDELLWLDRDVKPDREVEVFFNMSCSTQFVPHLMLDSASVLKALGVTFAAGSGRLFCCGTYYRRTGKFEGGVRMNSASVNRSISWGAQTAVHMCTQCVNTFSEISRRHEFDTGESQGIQHTQLLRFIDQRLEQLGDKVPWKTEVKAKVLSHGHSSYSLVHDTAKRDVGKIARRIPGVEFVGPLDRISIDSFCDSEPGVPKRARPKTREEVAAFRDELSHIAASWGADVISPSHQTCLQMWQPFASETVAVRHVMSLLAEALGVSNPDRYAAASRLGDTKAIVEQTRPIWSQWKMTEERAFETARGMFDPAYTMGDMCACGKNAADQCGHQDQGLIAIDVVSGASRPR